MIRGFCYRLSTMERSVLALLSRPSLWCLTRDPQTCGCPQSTVPWLTLPAVSLKIFEIINCIHTHTHFHFEVWYLYEVNHGLVPINNQQYNNNKFLSFIGIRPWLTSWKFFKRILYKTRWRKGQMFVACL